MLLRTRLRFLFPALLLLGAPAGLALLVGVGEPGIVVSLLALTALVAVKLVLDWPSRERWPFY